VHGFNPAALELSTSISELQSKAAASAPSRPTNSIVQNAPGQAAWFGAALALLNIMVGVIAQFIAAWTL